MSESGAGFTQANRLLSIATPLGPDVLVIKSLQMTDEMGRPFSCQAELRSTNEALNFDEIIGKPVTIRVEIPDGEPRFINGYVARFVQEGVPSANRSNRYVATIVPWLWLLTRQTDCRIFQNQTTQEILTALFGDFNIPSEAFSFNLQTTLKPREYVVQYRESAFNFVQRLMEQEGLYYFFKHSDGKHEMVITDQPATHVPAEGYAEIPFIPQSVEAFQQERIWEWTVEKQLNPTKYAHRDYDFRAPDASTQANKEVPRTHDLAGFEVFDYPGGHYGFPDGETVGEGTRLAQVRIDELAVQYEVVRGRGDPRGLVVGARFTLTGFSRADQEREYVVTSAFYHAEVSDYQTGSETTSPHMYQVGFTAIPADTVFRLQRTTPRPVVAGPQTAVVVGPAGEEVHTDEFGRVMVKFHWDRRAAGDDTSSCWIRVSQLWAGRGWGAMYIPRIGQEVIVDFLEGDPDRPIITGRVYNATNTVPAALPANKTQSTIKSNSSTGGEGFNEFRFEDKAGEEQIFMHAQKDLHVKVLNDRVVGIGNDDHLTVENDQKNHIKHDRNDTIDNDHKEKIGNDYNSEVTGKLAQKVGASYSLDCGDDIIIKSATNISLEAAAQISLKGDIVVIEAATNATVKCGDNFLAIDSSSLSLKAPAIDAKADNTIELVGGSSAKLTSDAAAEVKGANTTVAGDASVTVSGGSISIG
jgi:type VI secretion system secreted protein VgrG